MLLISTSCGSGGGITGESKLNIGSRESKLIGEGIEKGSMSKIEGVGEKGIKSHMLEEDKLSNGVCRYRRQVDLL